MIDGVGRLADLLLRSRVPVVFTGAGMSTESGIPDFRSPGGVWDRFDPDELTYTNFIATREGRRKYWELGRAIYPVIRAAAPNPGHAALVALYRADRLDCCITQNIDNLHQRAGLPGDRVIELHGNATRARCLECGARYARDTVHGWLEAGVDVPDCPGCGGMIKPETILFGETMPAREVEEAQRRARGCDLFVVIGSSLVVYPAAYIPVYAKQAGAALVIVNLTPTPLDAEADLVIRARAGEIMPSVVEAVMSSTSAEGSATP